MTARRIVAVTRRLLAQFHHDPRTLALMFVAPLLILSLFWFLLRGGGEKPAVGVVDQDRGSFGAVVAAQLEGSSLVHATATDGGTARSRLADGGLAGYVVLPADFSESLARRSPDIEIHLEGSQPSTASTVLQATQAALIGASGVSTKPHVTYLHGGPSLDTLDYFGGAFIGLVVFFLVFVLTCVAFLRERSQGTLERLMASPLRRSEVVFGYMLAFALLALLQSAEVLGFGLAGLKMHTAGNVVPTFGLAVLLAVG